jgi:hypothetical protein
MRALQARRDAESGEALGEAVAADHVQTPVQVRQELLEGLVEMRLTGTAFGNVEA